MVSTTQPQDGKAPSLVFKYGALPDGPYIRLLELKPGGENDDIKCLLRTSHLPDVVGKYDALSYVWGPESPSEPIELDGQTTQIRQNLFNFLVRLRSEDEVVTLWADAICINQQDVQEKNQQVQQMQDVYKSCRMARVWLNVSSAEVDGFLKLARSAAESGTPDLLTMTELERIVSRDMTAILESTYWTRLWIIQEVALSPNVEVYVSEDKFHTLEWTDLFQACETTISRSTMEFFEDDDFALAGYLPKCQAAWSIMCSLARLREGTGTDTLVAAVNSFSECSCVDSKDRIFGILGFVNDFKFDVDYDLDTTELFRRVLRTHPPHKVPYLAEPLYNALNLSTVPNMSFWVPIRIEQTDPAITVFGQLAWGKWPHQRILCDSYDASKPIQEGDVLCSFSNIIYPAFRGHPRFLFVLRAPGLGESPETVYIVAGVVLAFDLVDEAVPPPHWGKTRPLLGSKALEERSTTAFQYYCMEISISDFAVIHSLYGFDYALPTIEGDIVRGLANPDMRPKQQGRWTNSSRPEDF